MVKKNFSIIVQARLGSTRLPGKIFYKINGELILNILLNRLKKTKYVDDIIIATTKKKIDKKIVDFCKKKKIKCFRGPEKNVALRYFLAASHYKVKNIIRITSDCPLADPVMIDKMITLFKKKKVNYLSNIFPPTFPDGLDVEVFKTSVLKKILSKKKLLKKHKEHVTLFIRENEKKIYNYENKNDLSGIRLTLDYKGDLIFLRKIFKEYKKIHEYNYKEIFKIISKNPKMFKIYG